MIGSSKETEDLIMKKIVTITTVALICAAALATAGCDGAEYIIEKYGSIEEIPTQVIEWASTEYPDEFEEWYSNYSETDPDCSYYEDSYYDSSCYEDLYTSSYSDYAGPHDYGGGYGYAGGDWQYYENGDEKKRVSIFTDPSEYQHGYSSPYYEEYTIDHRYYDATVMYDYEGSLYSADQVDLEFFLAGVYDDGNMIEVQFSKCQYDLSGIDLGEYYTGYLIDIVGQEFTTMDGYYVYEIPYMDLWEDGSRHESAFYLEFSFGSNDPRGEFCMSKIGLLSDLLYRYH